MLNLLKNIAENASRKPVTRLYPHTKRPTVPGQRGHLDNRIEECIFCGICQKRCPALALEVTRKPNSWTLDPFACIVCGYCVEACPKHCLYFHEEHRAPSAAK